MLFNSPVFIFAFLPIVLLGFYSLARWNARAAAGWLALSSFVFYGWWNPAFLIILSGSILFNFAVSVVLRAVADQPRGRNLVLAFGVTTDLLVLFYYKYLAYVISVFASLGLSSSAPPSIILPLGLSFFTFTQIGYLVDCAQGEAREKGFVEYILFVSFFPHLIAGPILHHREIMPQFARVETYEFRWASLATGSAIFFLGLAKKVVLADSLIGPVNSGFLHPAQLGVADSWLTAIGYSLQLYFDFSAYSDMAIGLAYMFNVRFPLNFNSPYKSRSIIEFWQRWHMTLTRYLTLYVYNPLAIYIARRRARIAGPGTSLPRGQKTLSAFVPSIVFPTFTTMLIAGIWHGAGFQFVIFGLLHGFYLIVNHAWRMFGPARSKAKGPKVESWLAVILQTSLTYMAVVIADIFFRATSVNNAVAVISGMLGFGAGGADTAWTGRNLLSLVLCGMIAFGTPNIYQLMRGYPVALGHVKPVSDLLPRWQPSRGWAIGMGIVAAFAIANLWNVSEFIYFQF
jgi:alginate O-acetyltransferase complex protein AlgI